MNNLIDKYIFFWITVETEVPTIGGRPLSEATNMSV